MGKSTSPHVEQLNTFLATVTEKIGRQDYSSKAYVNPLAQFKQGFIENANEIEEIYVARVSSLTQDYTGVDTLKRVLPTVQTAYHKQNYGKCYTVSVSDKQIRRAFTTTGGVKKMSDEMLNQMQTGYQYDEYIAMRDNISDFASYTTTGKKTITEVTDNATAKAFIKQLKKDIAKMKFRGTNFCKYETHTPLSDLVLVVDTNLMAEIDVELLATAFNMSVVDVQPRIIEIDGFTNAKTRAVLMDKNAIKVFDTLYNIEPQRNAKGMFTNHHLNVEKIISTSDMYNGCVYSIA